MTGGSMRRSAPQPLRRVSDIVAEGGGRRGAQGGRRAGPRWPERFAESAEDRDALLVLLGLASLTAGRLLDLATVHRTASGCLAAVLRREAGSAADRTRAERIRPAEVRREIREAGARFVPVGDAEYPAVLLDLLIRPRGYSCGARRSMRLKSGWPSWGPASARRAGGRWRPRWRARRPGLARRW